MFSRSAFCWFSLMTISSCPSNFPMANFVFCFELWPHKLPEGFAICFNLCSKILFVKVFSFPKLRDDYISGYLILIVVDIRLTMLIHSPLWMFLFNCYQARWFAYGHFLTVSRLALHTGTLNSTKLVILSARIFQDSDKLSLCNTWFPGIFRCRSQHVVSVESSSLFHHSIYLWFICFPWWSIDELENFTRTEQLYVLSHDRSRGRGWETGLIPPVF